MASLRLTAASLRLIATDRAIVAEFPFLAAATRSSRTVGCCGKSTGVDVSPLIRAVFDLPADRKARFKALVGAATITGRVVRALRVIQESF